MDKCKNNAPDKKTTIVASKQKKYSIDIANLSETRFADNGSICEAGSGYPIYLTGEKESEHRQPGVWFSISNDILKIIDTFVAGASESMMKMRVKLLCVPW